jgi:uncharacterized SAM-binding protein YcdF (DUF218 family)
LIPILLPQILSHQNLSRQIVRQAPIAHRIHPKHHVLLQDAYGLHRVLFLANVFLNKIPIYNTKCGKQPRAYRTWYSTMTQFDAILIPGGGLTNDGSLPPWTIARLEHAISLKDQCRWFILLSGGTVHKPPPLNVEGFPILESRKGAEYLVNIGLDPVKILTEICSYDTIGNAYFSRLLFSEPLKLNKILIVTSEFHMPRTRAIFEWVYHLPPSRVKYQLTFNSTPNVGISSQILEARVKREMVSLTNLESTQKAITKLNEFQAWLYTEHAAYATNKFSNPISEDVLNSY